MAKARTLISLGLKASGKTTFLAALNHLLETSEVPGAALVRSKPPAQRKYLNGITEQWRGCKPVTRTTMSAEQRVTLHVRSQDGNIDADLHFPDLSGEMYLSQWRDRKIPVSYQALCQQAVGLLLFVHPYKVVEPMAITDADQILEALEDPSDSQATAPGEEKPASSPPWDSEKAPTQVQLVELVQRLQAAAPAGACLRVVVILSAWDLLGEGAQSPERWLADRLPLLHQFLNAHPERFSVQVYGVSAQGGAIDDEQKKDVLLDKHRPSERIQVIGPAYQGHDITVPVRWLLE